MRFLPVILLVLSYTSALRAQTMLDTDFGNNGLLSPIYNNSNQGGVLYLNPSSSGNFYAIASGSIVKYDESGSVITNFGTNGWFDNPYYVFNTYNYYYSPSFIIEQPDGSIIAGGDFYNNADTTNNDLFLFKTNPNGLSLDNNFGTNGIVTLNVSFQDNAYCMARQTDGKIILGGGCASNDTIVLVRFNTDGTLDGGFGVNGIVKTPVGQWSNYAKSISVLSNGKILVGARAYNLAGDYDFTVLRYNADGSLDLSFNNTGIVFGNANGAGFGLLADMQVQADNKILLTGGDAIVNDGYLVVRLNEDGTKDTTFNHTGIQKIAIDGSGTASKLALQQTGKIVVGGRYNSSQTKENWGLMRLTSSGALDTAFGDSGIVRLSLGDRQERILDLKIQSDEKILACGYYENGMWPNVETKMMIARFLKNGNTSVHNLYNQNGLICYPNPADNILYVQADNYAMMQSIEIFDVLGKRVGIYDTGNNKIAISTGQIAEGLYTLKIISKDHTSRTQKLVIQHH